MTEARYKLKNLTFVVLDIDDDDFSTKESVSQKQELRRQLRNLFRHLQLQELQTS